MKQIKPMEHEEVVKIGIEFTGDVCFSGEYGQQVYTKDMADGGEPVNGIVYERFPSGSLQYYCTYSNGIPNGERVCFYESGKIKSYCNMDTGVILGEKIEWYENGNIKRRQFCKYGIIFTMTEFDEEGNITKEKKQLTEREEKLYEKFEKWNQEKNGSC